MLEIRETVDPDVEDPRKAEVVQKCFQGQVWHGFFIFS